MFLVLSIILSITMISFTIIKKSSKKKDVEIVEAMADYYDSLLTNKQQSYKYLLLWCTDLVRRINNTEREKEVIEPLYKERMVSEELYNKVLDNIKDMNTEKMIIEQESRMYNRNVFREVRVSNSKVGNKIIEDIHFDKKREALEMELLKRLTN